MIKPKRPYKPPNIIRIDNDSKLAMKGFDSYLKRKGFRNADEAVVFHKYIKLMENNPDFEKFLFSPDISRVEKYENQERGKMTFKLAKEWLNARYDIDKKSGVSAKIVDDYGPDNDSFGAYNTQTRGIESYNPINGFNLSQFGKNIVYKHLPAELNTLAHEYTHALQFRDISPDPRRFKVFRDHVATRILAAKKGISSESQAFYEVDPVEVKARKAANAYSNRFEINFDAYVRLHYGVKKELGRKSKQVTRKKKQ